MPAYFVYMECIGMQHPSIVPAFWHNFDIMYTLLDWHHFLLLSKNEISKNSFIRPFQVHTFLDMYFNDEVFSQKIFSADSSKLISYNLI